MMSVPLLPNLRAGRRLKRTRLSGRELWEKINWGRAVLGGLVAGAMINAIEFAVHGVILDEAWTAAFRALGKTPKGWAFFIPQNFFLGLLAVWFYARIRPR